MYRYVCHLNVAPGLSQRPSVPGAGIGYLEALPVDLARPTGGLFVLVVVVVGGAEAGAAAAAAAVT
jgi:hypothetical protein